MKHHLFFWYTVCDFGSLEILCQNKWNWTSMSIMNYTCIDMWFNVKRAPVKKVYKQLCAMCFNHSVKEQHCMSEIIATIIDSPLRNCCNDESKCDGLK